MLTLIEGFGEFESVCEPSARTLAIVVSDDAWTSGSESASVVRWFARIATVRAPSGV